MCGIFGYLGRKNASSIIFEGLKDLEYRGYDSWGVAVSDGNGRIRTEKKVGKIGKAKTRVIQGTIGIGHTRWATHGGVTQKNAHPHLDCSKNLSLVHNGIVENYQYLKKQLQKNHKFVSETDTEVIIHLIEDEYREDLGKAVLEAFKKLKGLNAILVMDSKTNTLVAAKNGSPLVIGIDDDSYFVSSDASGILPHTKTVVFLSENQEAVVSRKGFEVFDIKNGKKIKPKIEKLNWHADQTDLGGFKHFLLKEIFEQPKVLEDLAKNHSEDIQQLARTIEKAHGTFMVGCGSASYAALCGQYLFSRVCAKHINFSIGSEFEYLEDYLTPKSLIIAFSQSGETMDTLESCYLAKKKGAKIAALVNVLGSTLYRVSDYKMLLSAGPEKAVCATKSFTVMIAILLLTSYEMAGKKRSAQKLLLDSSKNIKSMLQESYIKRVKNLAKIIAKSRHVFLIGRGLSYPISLEAALKIKEVSYIHAEGFAGGELKHGVIALIEKGTPCIVFAPNDETYPSILSNAEELKARGAYIIGISYKNNPVFDYFLEVANLADASAIANVVPAQLLAYYLCLEKGFDPDKPRNLAKSVTVK